MRTVAHLSAKVPTALRDALVERASENERSVSAELRVALPEHLAKYAPATHVQSSRNADLQDAA